MTFTRCLTVLVIALPLLAWVMEFLAGAVISERHHLHHDTYSVSMVVSRTLALVMLFMGALGGVTGWLCHLGVFSMRPLLPLAFFVSFQVTLLLMIVAVLRYRVMAYADHMIVRQRARLPSACGACSTLSSCCCASTASTHWRARGNSGRANGCQREAFSLAQN